MVTLNVSVTGAKQAAAVIDKMRNRLEEPSKFYRQELRPLLARNEEAAFATGGRSQGSPWKKLKQNTIRRKGHSKILVDSGALRAALTNPSARGNKLKDMRWEVYYGVSTGALPYAWYVSQQRKFARASEQTVRKATDELRDYLVGRQ